VRENCKHGSEGGETTVFPTPIVYPFFTTKKTWMPRTNPGMTTLYRHLAPGSEITRLATSLFQMNSTTSAPMVDVMKPAPWSGP
jgi:hypothetical protein